MLKEYLVELLYLIEQESNQKKEIKELRKALKERQENIDDVKQQVIEGLLSKGHKFATYKNMEVTLLKKSEKYKVPKDEVADLIENILCEDSLDNKEKKEAILKILTPQESGNTVYALNVKVKKSKKNNKEEE